jgi:L-alanine-DL-glutamate epimerase-like enolase superfamily enzyme
MHVKFRRVDWPFVSPFRIAYRTQTDAETVLVELTELNLTGRGEAMGVFYHGETPEVMLAQLEAVRNELISGISREELQKLLPAGGARNAIDCALWDLEAKRKRRRVWDIAGITPVKPLITAFTLSIDTPEAMSRAAAAVPQYSLLKLKLAGHEDIARVQAVRKARADADIIVDANQSWNEAQLREFAPQFAELGVKLIEQPLPAGSDDALANFRSPVPLCADESCQSTESLASLEGKYEYVNIKLDKSGGLTEGLRLAREAQRRNLKLMVGCMAGSSIAMAPAFIIGQLCSVVDLDGPLLSTSDVPNGIRYDGSWMYPPDDSLWG